MTLSKRWRRPLAIRFSSFDTFLWLLCASPLLQVMLFPLIQDAPRTPQGIAVQALRPLASIGALSVIVYTTRHYEGRRRWARGCITGALFFNMVFSIDRIVAGTAAPTPLTQILPLLIYLFALAATALYIEPHAWWLGSTVRTIVDGVAVGFASLLLLQSALPLLLHDRPWNPQVGIVLPYLALDMGLLFAVAAGGSRFAHSNRPFVAFILLSLLCLLIADSFYLLLAWVPWGQGQHWLLQPLFSLHVILLAFAAERDACAPTVPPLQQVPMPLREWLLWALVSEFFLLGAFFTTSLLGASSPLMLVALFTVAIVHALLAEEDRARVLRNLSRAEEQLRQTNNALAEANADLAAANRQLAATNDDLARAHAAAQEAAATSEAFIARIIHDLAPPVQGLTSVILADASTQLPGHDIAQRQLHLLDTFVQQARTYLQARTVTLRCTRLPLLPICRTAISTIAGRAQERSVRVMQEIEVMAPMVWGEETAILRILDNLLINALGVTPSGGIVLIRISTPAPGTIEVAIADQGPGIPQEKQATLFQPYRAMQRGALDDGNILSPSPTGTGMGLGLAIVKELTTALGGQCGVISRPEDGSTFYVRFRTEEPHDGNGTA